MKKGMIVLIVVILGLIIMSSALKPREDNTKVQTVINEPMNVAVVSGGNNISETNEEFSNTIQTGRYKATKDKKFIDIGSFYADYSKINKTLGWKPEISLREGLKRTVEYYRTNKEYYF